jgi:hypothetical protein
MRKSPTQLTLSVVDRLTGALPERVRYRYRTRLWRWRQVVKRMRIGLKYAAGTLTEPEARDLLWEAEQIAGIQSLESYGIESFTTEVLERFGIDLDEAPEYRKLAKEAIARMGGRFESAGHQRDVAAEFSMEFFIKYCNDDGLALKEDA